MPEFVEEVRDECLNFIRGYDGSPEYLEDYFALWVERGSAAVFTAGDFEAYLHGLLLVVDAWVSDPTVINSDGGQDRRVLGVLNPDRSSASSLCLERHYFLNQLHRYLRGDRH